MSSEIDLPPEMWVQTMELMLNSGRFRDAVTLLKTFHIEIATLPLRLRKLISIYIRYSRLMSSLKHHFDSGLLSDIREGLGDLLLHVLDTAPLAVIHEDYISLLEHIYRSDKGIQLKKSLIHNLLRILFQLDTVTRDVLWQWVDDGTMNRIQTVASVLPIWSSVIPMDKRVLGIPRVPGLLMTYEEVKLHGRMHLMAEDSIIYSILNTSHPLIDYTINKLSNIVIRDVNIAQEDSTIIDMLVTRLVASNYNMDSLITQFLSSALGRLFNDGSYAFVDIIDALYRGSLNPDGYVYRDMHGFHLSHASVRAYIKNCFVELNLDAFGIEFIAKITADADLRRKLGVIINHANIDRKLIAELQQVNNKIPYDILLYWYEFSESDAQQVILSLMNKWRYTETRSDLVVLMLSRFKHKTRLASNHVICTADFIRDIFSDLDMDKWPKFIDNNLWLLSEQSPLPKSEIVALINSMWVAPIPSYHAMSAILTNRSIRLDEPLFGYDPDEPPISILEYMEAFM